MASDCRIDLDGRVVRVVTVPLACCAVEVASALRGLVTADGDRLAAPDGAVARSGPADPGPLAEPAAPNGRAEQPDVSVMVVAGTITDAAIARVRQVWADLAAPRAVVSFGACTISGGPYWDSYAVTSDVAELLGDQSAAVSLVAGCPPRPADLGPALRRACALAAGQGASPGSAADARQVAS